MQRRLEMNQLFKKTQTESASYDDLIKLRFSRRAALLGLSSAAAIGAVGGLMPRAAFAAKASSTLTFTELTRVYTETHHVAPGYSANVLVRWGDPITANAPAFDPKNLSAAAQAQQFGYNCDFVRYLAAPYGFGHREHCLVRAQNEYPDPHIMFPGLARDQAAKAVTK